MRKMTRNILTLTALVLALVLLPVVAFAVSNETELKNAIAAGGPVTLDSDITITSTIDIAKDVVINGQGHTITSGTGIQKTITVKSASDASEANINVTFNNVKIVNKYNAPNTSTTGRAIDTRNGAFVLTLNNCNVTMTGTGNNQAINMGGYDTNSQKLVLNNTNVNAGSAAYAIVTWVPATVEVTGGTIGGYTALYVKDYGSLTATFDGVKLDTPNQNAGSSDTFAAIVLEKGDNNTITLNNCNVVNTAVNADNASQYLVLVKTDNNTINITGTLKASNGEISAENAADNNQTNVSASVTTSDGQGVKVVGNTTSNKVVVPQIPTTGDESNLLLWSALLVIGAAVLVMGRKQFGLVK